jgi:hypothetical protein
MFSGLQSRDGHMRMPVFGGGYRDCIDIPGFEKPAEVSLPDRIVTEPVPGGGREFVELQPVNVADVGDSGIL